MLSELIRRVYDNAAIDWATAEKVVYSMLVYMEEKVPPAEYMKFKRYMLGDVEYVMPDRSVYPGYAAEIPDQTER
jgi:hypothetical protein